jgi:hypothetical protein
MSNELALITNGQDAIALGNVLAKSGYFQDAKDAAQAAVKVLAGAELGIGPIAAMTGIYIVKGRVTMSANLMAAQIKRSGRYTYKITHHDNEACVLEFFEKGESIGESTFTKADATAAGLWNSSDPWRKTPRNMLFARAMSNGAKWFCPDIFAGPIYTPDELMADETQITVSTPEPAQPAALPAPQVDKPNGHSVPARADLVKQIKAQADKAMLLGYEGDLPTDAELARVPHAELKPLLEDWEALVDELGALPQAA